MYVPGKKAAPRSASTRQRPGPGVRRRRGAGSAPHQQERHGERHADHHDRRRDDERPLRDVAPRQGTRGNVPAVEEDRELPAELGQPQHALDRALERYDLRPRPEQRARQQHRDDDGHAAREGRGESPRVEIPRRERQADECDGEVAQVQERAGPHADGEADRDHETERRPPADEGVAWREPHHVVERRREQRGQRDVLRVVHRVAEVARREGEHDHRQKPRSRSGEQPAEPPDVDDPEPAERGADVVPRHVDVVGHELLGRDANGVEEAPVQVDLQLVSTRPEPVVVLPRGEEAIHPLSVELVGLLVPGHAEVAREHEHQREQQHREQPVPPDERARAPPRRRLARGVRGGLAHRACRLEGVSAAGRPGSRGSEWARSGSRSPTACRAWRS